MKQKSLVFTLLFSMFFYPINAELLNSGMSFLQIPSSAQSAATMTVFSQSSQSPLAIFENPVGIGNTQTTFALSHHFWFSDINIDVLAFSMPFRKFSVGFGLNYVRIPGVEIRETPTDEPLANVEPQYLAAAAAYTWSPLPKVTIGITGKFLYEHLYTYTDNGVAFDVAARWNAPSMLDISFRLQNIGYLHSGIDENRLPGTLTIGIVRPEIFEGNNLNGAIGLNLGSNMVSGEAFAQVGAELDYRDILSVRSGFAHIGSENRESIGFGIHLDRFTFDYAYLFMPEGFNNPHILTISYRP
ncbi:PorV/PorQ family protein [bacterium]|nr:PorV/PorQ family protein [bacterium]MBU1066127.1 PorV/PorQ family protein [bacterium]MBU1634279.1 PorV/PorQ family protein [bacterium]MBU1875269.1 PorV/PorQ family protein [bacterium]